MQVSNANLIIVAVVVVAVASIGSEAKNVPKIPISLDEESWSQILTGEWMVDFYAPWCPACKRLEPEWRKFAEWSNDLNIDVASADVTANPGLSGRFMISSLPTIYHVKDGVFRIYSGARDHASLIDFVEKQVWKTIEPISRWRAPNTLQMSFVAYSFRISMALRDVHNHLVDEVGMPYYVSYLIFALCTVIVGALLGLMIVFVIDQFIPARPVAAVKKGSKPAKASQRKKADKTSDSDLDDSIEVQDQKSSMNEKLRKRAAAANK